MLPIPTPFLEKCIKLFNHRIIFDFDDAIFLRPSWCKENSQETLHDHDMKRKISNIISLSSRVIAANEYLVNFAKKYNQEVTIIPTPIDSRKYVSVPRKKRIPEIIIGWVGTSGNLYYLNALTSVFENLFKQFPRLRVKIICDFVTGEEYPFLKLPQVIFKEWSIYEELKNLRSIDIGIMPLAADSWTRGKAGFKIIQYMALGIPVVASPIGYNRELIDDKINGFFANDSREWIRKLTLLIEDRKLRKKIGNEGKNFIERNYSIEVIYPKLAKIFEEILRS